MTVANRHPGYVIGYHGTSRSVVRGVVLREDDLGPSPQPYHWLGDGIYFWEGSVKRAEDWALEVAKEEPEVIGAVISLGHCLDLLDQESLDHVWRTYERLEAECRASGRKLPQNRKGRRELDCMVLNAAVSRPPEGRPPFDSVRAAFMEGSLLGKDSGIHRQSHIQIAVHNPNCIKGYFLPRPGSEAHQSV